MCAFVFSFFLILLSPSASDTVSVSTEINNVTVFQNQAQIHRAKEIELAAGTTTLVFEGLSEFVNVGSIQLKGNGLYTLLSLTTRNNFTEQQVWREDVQLLRDKRAKLEDELRAQKAEAEVVESEIGMLHSTQEIIKNNKLTSQELSDLFTLYRTNLGVLLTQKNALNSTIQTLSEGIRDLSQQIRESGQIKRNRFVEVVAEVQSESAQTLEFDLSYLVYNAGWSPSYDIRSADITAPMDITYKANIYQNTGIDWNDVKFVINSGDPSSNAIKPELNPFHLGWATRINKSGFNTSPNVVVTSSGESGIVRGRIFDQETGESLPGVNIGIIEELRGTVSDIDGLFELPYLSPGRYTLNFSFIGYKQIDVPLTISSQGYYLSIPMEQEILMLEEVVVTGYGGRNKINLRGLLDFDGPMDLPPPPAEPAIIQNQEISNQTSFSYEIGIPYSVPSDGKEHTVEIKQESIEAQYQFSTVPKLSNFAYLVGNIPDWNTLNLIEGEANIYFDNSFVGTTLLSPEAFEDTLAISLGKDERIVVERKKRNEFSKKNFFRSKVRELYSYEINLRNTKTEAITITVEDQVPLSTNDEINVTPKNLSNGKLDEETGIIRWELTLEPGTTETLLLEFEIEYPKGKRINY